MKSCESISFPNGYFADPSAKRKNTSVKEKIEMPSKILIDKFDEVSYKMLNGTMPSFIAPKDGETNDVHCEEESYK